MNGRYGARVSSDSELGVRLAAFLASMFVVTFIVVAAIISDELIVHGMLMVLKMDGRWLAVVLVGAVALCTIGKWWDNRSPHGAPTSSRDCQPGAGAWSGMNVCPARTLQVGIVLCAGLLSVSNSAGPSPLVLSLLGYHLPCRCSGTTCTGGSCHLPRAPGALLCCGSGPGPPAVQHCLCLQLPT